MRRGRKDGNHKGIKQAFEHLGCSVVDMADTGIPGWPDLAVGTLGITHLIELKSLETSYGRQGLNDNQTAFSRDWRGSPIHVVSSVEGAVLLVNHWRSKK